MAQRAGAANAASSSTGVPADSIVLPSGHVLVSRFTIADLGPDWEELKIAADYRASARDVDHSASDVDDDEVPVPISVAEPWMDESRPQHERIRLYIQHWFVDSYSSKEAYALVPESLTRDLKRSSSEKRLRKMKDIIILTNESPAEDERADRLRAMPIGVDIPDSDVLLGPVLLVSAATCRARMRIAAASDRLLDSEARSASGTRQAAVEFTLINSLAYASSADMASDAEDQDRNDNAAHARGDWAVACAC